MLSTVAVRGRVPVAVLRSLMAVGCGEGIGIGGLMNIHIQRRRQTTTTNNDITGKSNTVTPVPTTVPLPPVPSLKDGQSTSQWLKEAVVRHASQEEGAHRGEGQEGEVRDQQSTTQRQAEPAAPLGGDNATDEDTPVPGERPLHSSPRPKGKGKERPFTTGTTDTVSLDPRPRLFTGLELFGQNKTRCVLSPRSLPLPQSVLDSGIVRAPGGGGKRPSPSSSSSSLSLILTGIAPGDVVAVTFDTRSPRDEDVDSPAIQHSKKDRSPLGSAQQRIYVKDVRLVKAGPYRRRGAFPRRELQPMRSTAPVGLQATSLCPHAIDCPHCPWLHLSPAFSVEHKQSIMKRALQHSPFVHRAHLLDVAVSEQRNNTTTGPTGDGRLLECDTWVGNEDGHMPDHEQRLPGMEGALEREGDSYSSNSGATTDTHTTAAAGGYRKCGGQTTLLPPLSLNDPFPVSIRNRWSTGTTAGGGCGVGVGGEGITAISRDSGSQRETRYTFGFTQLGERALGIGLTPPKRHGPANRKKGKSKEGEEELATTAPAAVHAATVPPTVHVPVVSVPRCPLASSVTRRIAESIHHWWEANAHDLPPYQQQQPSPSGAEGQQQLLQNEAKEKGFGASEKVTDNDGSLGRNTSDAVGPVGSLQYVDIVHNPSTDSVLISLVVSAVAKRSSGVGSGFSADWRHPLRPSGMAEVLREGRRLGPSHTDSTKTVRSSMLMMLPPDKHSALEKSFVQAVAKVATYPLVSGGSSVELTVLSPPSPPFSPSPSSSSSSSSSSSTARIGSPGSSPHNRGHSSGIPDSSTEVETHEEDEPFRRISLYESGTGFLEELHIETDGASQRGAAVVLPFQSTAAPPLSVSEGTGTSALASQQRPLRYAGALDTLGSVVLAMANSALARRPEGTNQGTPSVVVDLPCASGGITFALSTGLSEKARVLGVNPPGPLLALAQRNYKNLPYRFRTETELSFGAEAEVYKMLRRLGVDTIRKREKDDHKLATGVDSRGSSSTVVDLVVYEGIGLGGGGAAIGKRRRGGGHGDRRQSTLTNPLSSTEDCLVQMVRRYHPSFLLLVLNDSCAAKRNKQNLLTTGLEQCIHRHLNLVNSAAVEGRKEHCYAISEAVCIDDDPLSPRCSAVLLLESNPPLADKTMHEFYRRQQERYDEHRSRAVGKGTGVPRGGSNYGGDGTDDVKLQHQHHQQHQQFDASVRGSKGKGFIKPKPPGRGPPGQQQQQRRKPRDTGPPRRVPVVGL